jgi:hypothetical protein
MYMHYPKHKVNTTNIYVVRRQSDNDYSLKWWGNCIGMAEKMVVDNNVQSKKKHDWGVTNDENINQLYYNLFQKY